MIDDSANFDVVISGGGMVGASLACALGSLPLRIALVEAVPFDSDSQPSFDARTTALSRTSQRILDSLGIWADVAGQANAIQRIHISERGRFGTAIIDGQEQGVDALGYVLENRVLGAALWSRIGRTDNIAVFCPAAIASAVSRETAMHLEMADDGGALSGRLLVVADGARSKLRSMLGIHASTRTYGQTAIVGNVALGSAVHGNTAFERFTVDGPVALLPADEQRFVFVLTRRADLAPAVMDLSNQAFLALLQETFGFRLGRFSRIGRRFAYPLSLVRSDSVIAARAAIIGNAAHGLHPVAGQGYNLGLRDVATLAEVIADELRRHAASDPGAPEVLQQYRGWRHDDQRNVVAFTDGLVRLFDVPLNSLGAARGLGLLAFDMMPGAKRLLARQTMGLGGRLTRLARGLPL
jgi:2-octaprenyl-6-methoxyphenol hydroxylase